MNDSLIPARYAKAFFKLVEEKKIEKEVYQAMRNLIAAFEGSEGKDLRLAIANPYVDRDRKRELILTAAGVEKGSSECKEAINDLLSLLFRNNRIDEFRNIVYAFDSIYRKENNISRVKVTWAAKPTEETEKRLKDMIIPRLGKGGMEYSSAIDPSLIGGFKIAIDNDQLDASVANELRQLRQQILSK